jgi:hypothetical protein
MAVMAMKILVVANTFGQLKEMQPYIEEIARDGSRVIFLLPYDPKPGWLQARLNSDQTEASMIEACVNSAEHYRWETRSRLAERTVSSIRNNLEKRGMEVSMQLYAGGMKKAIKELTSETNFELIVMPLRIMDNITNFLLRTKSNFFGPVKLSPVLVFLRAKAS